MEFRWLRKAHFIHRLDIRGTDTVSMSIAEGNNKVEVFEGGNWIEANGYTFTQKLQESTQGSGNSNTLQNWRLKMRRKNGASGIVNITISKGSDSDYLFYWGVEKWNDNRLILSILLKGGVGSLTCLKIMYLTTSKTESPI